MALVITVEDGSGKLDSNAYQSNADVTDYLLIEGAPEWDALDDDGKSIINARASRLLDRYTEYVGTKQTGGQALEWPRLGAFDYSKRPDEYRCIESSFIPKALKQAHSLLCDALASGEYDTKTVGQKAVKSLSLPDFNISLGDTESEIGLALPLPVRIVNELKPISYNAWGARRM